MSSDARPCGNIRSPFTANALHKWTVPTTYALSPARLSHTKMANKRALADADVNQPEIKRARIAIDKTSAAKPSESCSSFVTTAKVRSTIVLDEEQSARCVIIILLAPPRSAASPAPPHTWPYPPHC